MAFGTVGKGIMGPLLVVNFVLYIIVVGLASWSLDKYINGENLHPYLRGNPSTSYLLMYALLAGVTGACSMLVGFMHLRAWRSDSLAAASSSALISWAITFLAFGFACKHVGIGNRGRSLRTLEAFVTLLTMSQSLYVGLLHLGIAKWRYGPSYRHSGVDNGGTAGDTQRTNPPSVI